ncbi:MAG: DUF4336 domain-containing protein [Pseudomonadota bacterium]
MALETVADTLWIAEGEVVDFHGFPYPTRSVIARLAGGDLWVWSPVGLSRALKGEIDRLGVPRHLVSPSKIHHLFLAEWHQAYPEALLWGPGSTVKKRADLSFEAPLEHSPPPGWNQAFDQAWFKGSPFMDEIVFFHRQSRTAILADLSENFSDAFLRANWAGWQRWIAGLWGIVEGRGYAPLEWRLSFFKRREARVARDRVLAWDPERVIMAHGEWQRSGGWQFLEKAFSWLG